MAVTTYKKAKSGLYNVELAASFEDRGFIYKPGTKIIASQGLLDAMIAAGVVSNVVAAD